MERRRGTMRRSRVSVSFVATDEQVETFESFVDNDLGGASLSFYFRHPRRETQVRARILGDEVTVEPWAFRNGQVAFMMMVTS